MNFRSPPSRAAALVALTLALAAGTARAAPDERLLDAAKKAQPAVIETLKTLVAIESGSRDLEGLAKMADVVEQRLRALGMRTERRKSTADPGADIVVGTLTGSGRQRVMLQGHTDTVYPKGILQSQPMRQDGNRLYGPGIADDKGGIATILHGLKILLDSGWRDFATLTVLFNPDEEIGSPGSGETIATLGEQHDTVLSFEPTGAKDVVKAESVLLGAAGAARVVMEVKGRSSHAGAAPDQGRNAALELAHQIVQTRDIAKSIPGAQLNWTSVSTNNAFNQIPETATAVADVRSLRPDADLEVLAALRARATASPLVPDTRVTFEILNRRPAYLAGAKGKALAELAQSIYKEMDRPLALVPMTGGGTDAGFAARSGKPAVLESLGLPGWGYHARDEYIEIDAIVPRLYLVTRMLVELGKR
ncbi:MAG: glutamate carboxypeptidase [Burkholderiaceae bacterium]